MPENKISERRRFTRVPADFPIEYSEFSSEGMGKGTRSSLTKNISANGILFASDKSPPVGDLLRIVIQVKSWQKYRSGSKGLKDKESLRPIEVIGKVVRVEEIIPQKRYEIGICFVNVDPEDQTALMEYLEKEASTDTILPSVPAIEERSSVK